MKPQQEIGEEFKKKFSFLDLIHYDKGGNAYTRIKAHISQIRKNDIESLIEGINKNWNNVPPDCDEYSYHRGLNDLLSHLSEELKKIK